MSSRNRPARRRPSTSPRPSAPVSAIPFTAPAAQPYPAQPFPGAMPAPQVWPELAHIPSVAAMSGAAYLAMSHGLERHAQMMVHLLDQAGRVAQGMLDKMESRQARGEEVFPREYTYVCRGMTMLAKCGAELDKMVRTAQREAVKVQREEAREQRAEYQAQVAAQAAAIAAAAPVAAEENLVGPTIELSDDEQRALEAKLVHFVRAWEESLLRDHEQTSAAE